MREKDPFEDMLTDEEPDEEESNDEEPDEDLEESKMSDEELDELEKELDVDEKPDDKEEEDSDEDSDEEPDEEQKPEDSSQKKRPHRRKDGKIDQRSFNKTPTTRDIPPEYRKLLVKEYSISSYLKENGFKRPRLSADFVKALDGKVKEWSLRAAKRAKKNKRSTLMEWDL